jgi:hypothetical protein
MTKSLGGVSSTYAQPPPKNDVVVNMPAPPKRNFNRMLTCLLLFTTLSSIGLTTGVVLSFSRIATVEQDLQNQSLTSEERDELRMHINTESSDLSYIVSTLDYCKESVDKSSSCIGFIDAVSALLNNDALNIVDKKEIDKYYDSVTKFGDSAGLVLSPVPDSYDFTDMCKDSTYIAHLNKYCVLSGDASVSGSEVTIITSPLTDEELEEKYSLEDGRRRLALPFLIKGGLKLGKKFAGTTFGAAFLGAAGATAGAKSVDWFWNLG